jgi:cell division protein FtsL
MLASIIKHDLYVTKRVLLFYLIALATTLVSVLVVLLDKYSTVVFIR